MKYRAVDRKRLINVTLALLAVGLLSSCSHHDSKPVSPSATALNSTACSGNRYLQKFSCSLDRVEAAAQEGDPDAQYALGYMYYYGIGTVRDTNTATLWIRRSASQGQPIAKKALALMTGGTEISTLHHHDSKVSDPRLMKSTKPMTMSHQKSSYHPAHASAMTAMESNLMKAHPNHFTLQLMAAHDAKIAHQFITRNHLQGKAQYYRAKYGSGNWYRVVYGDYSSASQAHAAIRSLPANLRQQRPWAKSFRSVQKEILSR